MMSYTRLNQMQKEAYEAQYLNLKRTYITPKNDDFVSAIPGSISCISGASLKKSTVPTNCKNCGALINKFNRCNYCNTQY